MEGLFLLIGILGIIILVVGILSYHPDSGDVNQRITNIQNKQGTNMNQWAAEHHAKSSELRTRHNQALVNEAASTYDLNAVLVTKEREEIEKLALHQNLLVVTQEATKHKLGTIAYEALKLAEGTAQIEILKAQGLKDIEWEFLEKEHHLQLKGAMLLAIKRQKELEGLMDLFEAIARRVHQIETGDDPQPVKDRLLPRLNRNLQIVGQAMDGENRLLQEMDGQES